MTRHLRARDDQPAHRQIDLLALIKVDNTARQIQVHRVVQAVVSERMTEEEREAARHDVHRLLAAAPEGRRRRPADLAGLPADLAAPQAVEAEMWSTSRSASC